MKILLAHSSISGAGGGERFLYQLAEYLTSNNHEVEIWTWNYEKETTFPQYEKFKIREIKQGPNFMKAFVWAIQKPKGFDAIIANGFPAHFLALSNKNVTWKVMALPAYLGWKDNAMKKILYYLDKRAVSKAKNVIVDGNNMKNRVEKIYGRTDGIVIPHGINLEEFKAGELQNYFLHVSRINREKNIEKLIKEWDLKEKLVIVGGGDGPYERELKRLAKGKNVEFKGRIVNEKLVKLYSNCTAVLLASENEPFGLTLIEGMASGKPVIAINNGGPKDIVENEKTGFLCKNHEEMVEKARMFAKNKQMATIIGEQALIASKKYDLTNYFIKIETIIST